MLHQQQATCKSPPYCTHQEIDTVSQDCFMKGYAGFSIRYLGSVVFNPTSTPPTSTTIPIKKGQ